MSSAKDINVLVVNFSKILTQHRRCAFKILLESGNKNTFFETENVTSLNDEEKLSCKGIVCGNKCLRALNEFKNCKSPGTDGL